MDCLELGCGAGQNSIVLAGRGANCLALDISQQQLAYGQKLATEKDVLIDFIQGDLDHLPSFSNQKFHLIHSTYALPFATDPEQVIRQTANLLLPQGMLILTVGHPLFAGEWLEVEEEGEGMFIRNYFNPPADTRFTRDGKEMIHARFYPISTMIRWILNSGLVLEQMLEPSPLPVPAMDEKEIQQRIPYDSPGWRALYPQLQSIPSVAIFVARNR